MRPCTPAREKEGQQGRSREIKTGRAGIQRPCHTHTCEHRSWESPRSHQPAISTSTAARYLILLRRCGQSTMYHPLLPRLPSFYTQGYLLYPLYLPSIPRNPPPRLSPPLSALCPRPPLHSKAPKQVGRSALPSRGNSCAIHVQFIHQTRPRDPSLDVHRLTTEPFPSNQKCREQPAAAQLPTVRHARRWTRQSLKCADGGGHNPTNEPHRRNCTCRWRFPSSCIHDNFGSI